MAELSPKTREALARVGTSTLTGILSRRGFKNMFMQEVWPIRPDQPRLVGIAYTMRFIPAREDKTRNPAAGPIQQQAMEGCPPGHVLVMDCRNDPIGASGGDILLTRLMKRGVAGVVTDGSFRDSPTIAKLPFPAFVQGMSPNISLTRHHAVDMQVPIACAGIAVYPGDVLVGDEEGIMVIPRGIVAEVAAGAVERDLSEEFVMEKIHAGASITGVYPFSDETKREYEAWKAKRKK